MANGNQDTRWPAGAQVKRGGVGRPPLEFFPATKKEAATTRVFRLGWSLGSNIRLTDPMEVLTPWGLLDSKPVSDRFGKYWKQIKPDFGCLGLARKRPPLGDGLR